MIDPLQHAQCGVRRGADTGELMAFSPGAYEHRNFTRTLQAPGAAKAAREWAEALRVGDGEFYWWQAKVIYGCVIVRSLEVIFVGI